MLPDIRNQEMTGCGLNGGVEMYHFGFTTPVLSRVRLINDLASMYCFYGVFAHIRVLPALAELVLRDEAVQPFARSMNAAISLGMKNIWPPILKNGRSVCGRRCTSSRMVSGFLPIYGAASLRLNGTSKEFVVITILRQVPSRRSISFLKFKILATLAVENDGSRLVEWSS